MNPLITLSVLNSKPVQTRPLEFITGGKELYAVIRGHGKGSGKFTVVHVRTGRFLASVRGNTVTSTKRALTIYLNGNNEQGQLRSIGISEAQKGARVLNRLGKNGIPKTTR